MGGLPEALRSGLEQMSGVSLDDVKVHYNSLKPMQSGAAAYTQGTEIHIAPGQERHLPHEAWHVVQQRCAQQGKLLPAIAGTQGPLTSGPLLEGEADRLAIRAGLLGQDQL